MLHINHQNEATRNNDVDLYHYATSRKTNIRDIRRRLTTLRCNPEMK